MFAITGISGKVGGEVARTLLANRRQVRAVLRDPAKGGQWTRLGCDIAIADMADTEALARAFKDAQGVFILLPPVFDPAPDFSESKAVIAAVRAALLKSKPRKVVMLSTIGAQAKQPNLLTQLSLMEQALGDLPMPVTFLRPAWFMENASWDVQLAKETGVIGTFLQPLGKAFPMVATADVGRTAADLLLENSAGRKIVELEGPNRVSPTDIATTFAAILGRPVRAEPVPRDTWETLFRAQGMKNPTPRIQMIDGFNAGWIDFEFDESKRRRGTVPLKTVLAGLVHGG